MMLGDVCNVIMGQAPSGSSYNEEEVGLPLIAGAGDLGAIYPAPTRFTSSPGKKSIVGDIILCIRATIGTKNWADKEYCLGRGVAALRPKDPTYLIPSYLWHWTTATEQALIRKGKGATFLQVSKSDIEELPCNLPSPEEQQRIAAILDKADAIRRKRADSLKLADEFLKSVFLDMFGDPVTNEKGFQLSILQPFLVHLTSGGRNWTQYLADSGKRFIRSFDVQMNEITQNAPAYVIPPQNKEAERTRVQAGDVLLTITGSKIGRVCCVPDNFEEAYVSQHVAIIRTRNINPIYLSFYLSMESCGQRIIAEKQYGQTKPGLSLGQLSDFTILTPPLDLQKKFADIVHKVEAHKQRAMQGQGEADDLFKALQQQFFG